MAIISPDDALILPYRANPPRMEFLGTTGAGGVAQAHAEPVLASPVTTLVVDTERGRMS